MQKKSLLIILLGLSANLFIIGCADDQARSQIADTNAKLAQLQSNVGVIDNKVSNQKMIDILNKLDDLQSQIDQLNGQISTLNSNQKNHNATQDQLNQSMDQRLQDLERSGSKGSYSVASAPASTKYSDNNNSTQSSANATGSNGDSSSKQLKSALRKIKSHNFPQAINELKNIISTSNNPEVVTSASYYLCISYAANGQYKDAITTGRKFANDYPDSANAPDALRTVYISQNQLNMKQSAAKTAKLIISKYPDSDAAQKIQAENQQK